MERQIFILGLLIILLLTLNFSGKGQVMAKNIKKRGDKL